MQPFLKLCLVLFLVTSVALAEGKGPMSLAGALYYKLTGTPLMDENPLRPMILAHVANGNLKAAAQAITDPRSGSRYFYDNVVKNFALTFNRNHSTTNPANDLTAFIIGSVMTGKTIDEMLTGNYYFMDPFPPTGVAVYAENSDQHYDDLDKKSSFRDRLKQATRGAADIGLFTTRSWASDFYSAGTNRRPWKGIIELLYCVNQTDTKTLFIPEDKVRRDVPRVQNGSVSIYQNTCRGCHAQMDPISNAFGLWDFVNNAIKRQTSFFEKINETPNYPTYRPTSDTWWLYTTDSQDAIFGFNDVPSYGANPPVTFVTIDQGLRLAQGQGLPSFARVIAASDGFPRCLVTRLVTQMYLKKSWGLPGITETDIEALGTQDSVIDEFSSVLKKKRTLRDLFEDLAIKYIQ